MVICPYRSFRQAAPNRPPTSYILRATFPRMAGEPRPGRRRRREAGDARRPVRRGRVEGPSRQDSWAPSRDPRRTAAGADGDGAGRDAQGRRADGLQGGGVRLKAELCAWGRGQGGGALLPWTGIRIKGRRLRRFFVVFGSRTSTSVPSLKPGSASGPSSNGRFMVVRKDD